MLLNLCTHKLLILDTRNCTMCEWLLACQMGSVLGKAAVSLMLPPSADCIDSSNRGS